VAAQALAGRGPKTRRQPVEAGLQRVGIEREDENEPLKTFTQKKRAFGRQGSLVVGNLIIWLRDWKGDRWQS